MTGRPNIVFVFGDQWRAQATGYAGDPNARTPHLDRLARESVNFTQAVSGCPVCSPARASLLTGQYPLTHGVFVNNVPLRPAGPTLGALLREHGYDTAWIGKWHLDGHGRSAFIPPERRLGFDYWKAQECTHDYFRSGYYAGDSDIMQTWPGYDAFAQTEDAMRYIQAHRGGGPFALMLSWGPPHDPYHLAPPRFRSLYRPDTLSLRPNVPPGAAQIAASMLAGYYAHCAALDYCVGALLHCLDDAGLRERTVFVFTSDHGDMLGSQGAAKKQHPWDESIRIPLLIRYPDGFGADARIEPSPVNITDLMPTLLGLADIGIPAGVEGRDLSGHLLDGGAVPDEDVLIACYHPFGEWAAPRGGREYRGLRARDYTYVRDRNGPWLLYDNRADPYQRVNRVGDAGMDAIRADLDRRLAERLARDRDGFRPGMDYIRQWGYQVDETGTVPFTW